MKIRKDVGLIIKFDDVEYSKEECASLYQQFFELLCEVAKYKYCPKNIGKILADAVFERKKQTSKETRTSETQADGVYLRLLKCNQPVCVSKWV